MNTDLGGGIHEDRFANALSNSIESVIWERIIKPNPRSRAKSMHELIVELLNNPKAVSYFTQTNLLTYFKSHPDMACKFEWVASKQKVTLSMGTRKNFR